MLGLAVVISLGLTGLTVWAVARQGGALRDRDLADLRNAASRAAAERTAALRGDLERVFTAAWVAWQAGQVDGLEQWLEGQRPWSQALLHSDDGEWTIFPRPSAREPLPAVAEGLATACSGSAASGRNDICFATAGLGAGQQLVVAARRLSGTACLGLVATADELIGQYWPPAAEEPWRVAAAGESGAADRLCSLGPPFAHADLVSSGPTAQRLAAESWWRGTLLAATAVGTSGAWGIVIWMMLRGLARQRELVRLQRRFVADVSHELKTPLTMIRLLAETLQDGRIRDPQRVRTYYETITREAERLSVLLDGILDFSRAESGRKQYEFADCNVAQVAREAWRLFEPQFAAEGFEREIQIAVDLPTIRADAAALHQVIVNLLQNAYRYAGEGKYIRLAVTREGYLIVITIEDHGIGMTRLQLERLGDSFFRAEDTRVRQTRGTGLGLAIVNHVVQAHGGKLEVQSRPGRGSTFTVWIPFEPTADSKCGK